MKNNQWKPGIGRKIKDLMKLVFIDAMGGMALGLFATLLVGTIVGTVAKYTGLEFLDTIANFAKGATGMAIGVAIASSLKMQPLVVFSAAVVGSLGNELGAALTNGSITGWAVTAKGSADIFYGAGPAGAFLAVVIACGVGSLVSKKTPVDILVTPVVTIFSGFAAAFALCPLISFIMYYLGVFIATATTFQPFFMGIVVSVVVGMILTLPISSAAICAMIFSESAFAAAAANGTEEGLLLAGGAAVAGCCAQMIGFTVISFRENKWGGLVSQGLGTSMLQMGNIVRKPAIWIAPTLAAAVTGPVSTMIFKLQCKGLAAGMGTCGLVGPIGVIDSTPWDAKMWIGLVLVCFVLPAVLSFLFNEILRKTGLVKTGDMKLSL